MANDLAPGVYDLPATLTFPIRTYVLCEILHYDPETGHFEWKPRSENWFGDGGHRASHNCRKWNSRYAGQAAFLTRVKGYCVGSLFGRRYNAHHVAWAMMRGSWPTLHIDHINGVRSDNRIDNLREATVKENGRNTKLPSTNSTGVVGLEWVGRTSRWRARIQVDGRTIHLGYFADRRAAIAARKAAEDAYGFHPNHGRVMA